MLEIQTVKFTLHHPILIVMAELDSAIHDFIAPRRQVVDARLKVGHDGRGAGALRGCSYSNTARKLIIQIIPCGIYFHD